jgi:membrane-associated phospholipid phosphatase
MKGLGAIISTHRWYFTGYILLLLITTIPQLYLNQNALFLEINKQHSGFLDFFFYWLTYLGDGLTFVLIIIALLFLSYSKALTGLIIFLSTSLLAQFLKRVFFADYRRPFSLLSDQHELHVLDQVTPLSTLSFPSGHSVTVFALATFLVLAFPNKKVSLIWLVLAWLTAYSRVYLTHHFPIDIWAGSIIGTLGALLIFWSLGLKFDHKFGNKSLLSR